MRLVGGVNCGKHLLQYLCDKALRLDIMVFRRQGQHIPGAAPALLECHDSTAARYFAFSYAALRSLVG